MRNPSQRLADLRAQRAANELGRRRLAALADELGLDALREGTAAVLDYGERRTRAALAALGDGSATAAERMEPASGELRLQVEATIAGEELTLDFTGSSAQVEGNLNCPLPVTRSAALFAVRALLDPDAPPSAGGHRPVRILADPRQRPATPIPAPRSPAATSRPRAASPTS